MENTNRVPPDELKRREASVQSFRDYESSVKNRYYGRTLPIAIVVFSTIVLGISTLAQIVSEDPANKQYLDLFLCLCLTLGLFLVYCYWYIRKYEVYELFRTLNYIPQALGRLVGASSFPHQECKIIQEFDPVKEARYWRIFNSYLNKLLLKEYPELQSRKYEGLDDLEEFRFNLEDSDKTSLSAGKESFRGYLDEFRTKLDTLDEKEDKERCRGTKSTKGAGMLGVKERLEELERRAELASIRGKILLSVVFVDIFLFVLFSAVNSKEVHIAFDLETVKSFFLLLITPFAPFILLRGRREISKLSQDLATLLSLAPILFIVYLSVGLWFGINLGTTTIGIFFFIFAWLAFFLTIAIMDGIEWPNLTNK